MSKELVSKTHIEEITEEVRSLVNKWKSKEGNLIMILHGIEDHYGYIPRNISMFLAEQLRVPLARIYEVITFYNYFKLEPPADYTVAVCTGTACHLKGADKLIDEFRKQLNIPLNQEYSNDNKFKIEEVRCVGCCGLAPVVTINEEVHGRKKPEHVKDMLADLL